jgi:hypothetical protein
LGLKEKHLYITVLQKLVVPNLGDMSPWGGGDSRGLKSVITWLHLHKLGEATDVGGTQTQKGWGSQTLTNEFFTVKLVLLIKII